MFSTRAVKAMGCRAANLGTGSYLQVQWFTVVCSIRLRLVYTKASFLGVFQLRVGFIVLSVSVDTETKGE